MAVDVQKLFNEELPAAFAKNPDAAKQINLKFQWNITGDGGGFWYVDASDSGPSITKGNPGYADCEVTLDSEYFQILYEDPDTKLMELFLSGRLEIIGSLQLCLKISELFSLG
jgi:hypothetical protein